MTLLSQKALSIKPSPTISITTKALELKKAGIDVISLSVGEPDFNTPANICEAAKTAMNSGKTKYTAVDGIPELKKAIQSKFKRENELEYEPNEITVGSGAKQVIFNAFMASINDGDEVIIPAPYWVSYPEMVEMFGGKSIIVQTTQANRFKMTASDLAKAITPKTKWIILNSPSNPTGEVYAESELRAIADVLIQNEHVHILSDDIYEHLIYDPIPYKTIAQIEPKLLSRTLTINGVSKSYAMTGWRLGYGAIKNAAFIKAIANIQSQSTSNPSSISQWAAVEALNGDQSFLTTSKSEFKQRRDYLCAELSKINGIELTIPSGAFYVFFSIQKLLGRKTKSGKTLNTCFDFVEYLLEEAKIAAVHGSAFGADGFIRFSYAISLETLKEAVLRLQKAISDLS